MKEEEMTEKLTIGQSIKAERKAKHYTTVKLEAKSGISRQSISRWEHDVVYPSVVSAITLADVLGVTLDELVGRNYEKIKDR